MNQKKKLSRKVISYVLAFVMVLSTFTGIVPGMSLTAYAASTELTAETTTWETGDYVVPAGGVTISGHITVNGNINLTLTEGATLTANTGITLSDGATLTVQGNGSMNINGTNNSTASTVEGNGTLVLTSGTLTAKGGNGGNSSWGSSNNTTSAGGVAINGSVTLTGGTLTATGGNGGSGGAHSDNNTLGDGAAAISGSVTMSGGTLAATGGNGGNAGEAINGRVDGYGSNNKGGAGGAAINGALSIDGGEMTATIGTSGTVKGDRNSNSSAGAAGAGIGGTLTLGKDVTLYDGLGAVLDDNNSSSREYTGDRKQIMHAVYEAIYAVTLITHTPAEAEGTVSMTYGDSSSPLQPGETSLGDVEGKTVTLNINPKTGYRVKSVTVEKPAATTTTLDNTITAWTAGTYAVPAGGLTYSDAITVAGDVTLLLPDGETLTLNKGIGLAEGATLTVQGGGTMNVNGTDSSTASTVAGTGTLVLTGGTLTAKGGNGQSFSDGVEQTGNTGGVAINGTVIVNSGTLVATGGNGGSLNAHTISQLNGGTGGAAIGGAVTINGGTVTATGGNGGSITITNYGDSNKGGNGGAAIGGAVTINGGTLTATKGDNGTLNIRSGSPNYAGTGSAGYSGTLTLGANVKLYEGTDNTGTVLDGNDSDSRVYSSEKKANMYAYGPDVVAEPDNESNPEAAAAIIEAEKQTDGSWQFTMPDYSVTINIEYEEGADKTALNDAITAAKKLYDSIKDNDDYTDIANTLKTAIDTAQQVADSDKADQDAVDAATSNIITANTNVVIGIINALPSASDVTTADREVIETVREAYDALDDAQKALVDADTLKKLTDAEDALATIDQVAAGNVNTAIGNLPAATDVTADDRADIKAAREAYDALDETQKKLVDEDTLKKLTDAEDALSTIDQTAADNATTAIGNLPAATDVTVDDRADIKTARGAYDALDDAQKALVDADTLKKLTDAEDALSTIDQTAASNATTAIGNLPAATDVTADDRADIKAAREAYDALDDAQKALVDANTLKKLTDAEDALATIDQTAAGNATTAIGNLPTATDVTADDRADIKAAREAYDALDDAQKALVDANTLKKLTDAEEALATIDQTAADNATTAIGNLPTATDVTVDDRADIKTARGAYDALDDAQKALVDADTLKKLTDAEDALAAIDQAVADNVTSAIENLPAVADVTVDSREAIEVARKTYDALDEAQKKLVDENTLKKLTDTEKALKDAEIAKNATDVINALPASDKVATTDKAAIEAARKAYDALTVDQQKKVPADTLKKLTDAETALTAAEKKAAEEEAAKKKDETDTKAANAVVETINKLPVSNKVATTDKAAIEAARKAYDALTADQKKKVSADTLKKLTDAETALTAAEKKAAEDKAAAEKKAAEEKAARELAAAKQEAQAAMNEQVTVTQKGNKFTVKWKKSSSADGYYVYASYCGKKAAKPAKTIKKNTTTKTTITKINGKKINQKKNFHVYVVPYKIIDGKKVTLGKSTVAHLVGSKNAKYSNVKKLTLTKSKYTVKVGKTKKIKAKVTLVNKNKKHIPKSHGAKFRYKSSDTGIATVDKNGKFKGIKKGTCTIYVYSINGLMKKAKVTVK